MWERVASILIEPWEDTFMSKTARLYRDTRSATASSENNLDKLNGELQDVTRIMTKNMEELLWRGDSLDSTFLEQISMNLDPLALNPGMSHLSTSLRSESAKYRKAARNINTQGKFRAFSTINRPNLTFFQHSFASGHPLVQ